MEPVQTPRRAAFLKKASATGILFAVVLSLLYCKRLDETPLSKLVRADLPILTLQVKPIDVRGREIPLEKSHIVGMPPGEQSPATGLVEGCGELVGGDTPRPTILSSNEPQKNKDCPNLATWYVKRRPIGFTLHVQDGRITRKLLDRDTEMRAFFASRFAQGLFLEPLVSAKVRAEDLHLEGLKGFFFREFMRESLDARAELHYDVVHGRQGFVFSFVRKDCPLTARVLPALARVLARSGYKVPKLSDPVLELRLGVQRLFLTQYGARIYLANGLESLLNVIEHEAPPDFPLPDYPLALTVRAEAFLDRFPVTMVGIADFAPVFGFDVGQDKLGILQIPAGKYASHLQPRIFRGVYGSIPHDTFAAVAASLFISPGKSIAEWQRLATEGPGNPDPTAPAEAGLAVLWELSADERKPTQVGVVIANQQTPDAVGDFTRYFSDPDLTASCGGGTVFLAATSPKLLARMRESCAGQSLSVLDWSRGAAAKNFDSAQLALFVNPGAAMRELYLAGGARPGDLGDSMPEWKQEYEQAKKVMREDSEKVFATLPLFAWAGNVKAQAPIMALQGFVARQQGGAP